MAFKSSMGQSSVSIPSGIPTSPNGGNKVISGKAIVHKPINRHHANPGFKGKTNA